MEVDKSRLRTNLPQIGEQPYRQVHAHSTGNPNSTAQNEADYHMRRPVESGFFSHVVGNGRIMQTWLVDRGAYDVGGGWNVEGYAQVELIESHESKEEFMRDYRLYVKLLRELADEAGIPKTLDSSSLAGIKTHQFCTYNQPNNGSDHVDPYPYLAKWGISREQFKKDIESGLTEGNWKRNEVVGGGKKQMAFIQNLNGKISTENGSTLIIEATVSSINGSMMARIGFI